MHLPTRIVAIVAILAITCIVTSSAQRCNRQVTRYRNNCQQSRQSYTAYSAAWCPFRRIYYTRQRTAYRMVRTCTREPYSATEYYCCTGYRASGSSCVDVNECTNGQHQCQNGGTCVNTPGDYTCNCTAAYNGSRCTTDIDECQSGTHDCHAQATCTNLQGSFACTCNSGYEDQNNDPTQAGRNCVDKDECALGEDACENDSYCFNTDGSYACECQLGYTGRFCQDISRPGLQ